ncbi:UNKNOWN [Stylonychia lemnae]|uniref:Uncharacterized protein n=1 Tax=Stylonychia lemnae TaxID=5949 RepID=A0A078AB79_STYLE|nr:UNKNOWN [Stylonychia lemnae]|eukprot:CDW79141.1 UNKNOWN [Stylonychia lemnae]
MIALEDDTLSGKISYKIMKASVHTPIISKHNIFKTGTEIKSGEILKDQKLTDAFNVVQSQLSTTINVNNSTSSLLQNQKTQSQIKDDEKSKIYEQMKRFTQSNSKNSLKDIRFKEEAFYKPKDIFPIDYDQLYNPKSTAKKKKQEQESPVKKRQGGIRSNPKSETGLPRFDDSQTLAFDRGISGLSPIKNMAFKNMNYDIKESNLELISSESQRKRGPRQPYHFRVQSYDDKIASRRIKKNYPSQIELEELNILRIKQVKELDQFKVVQLQITLAQILKMIESQEKQLSNKQQKILLNTLATSQALMVENVISESQNRVNQIQRDKEEIEKIKLNLQELQIKKRMLEEEINSLKRPDDVEVKVKVNLIKKLNDKIQNSKLLKQASLNKSLDKKGTLLLDNLNNETEKEKKAKADKTSLNSHLIDYFSKIRQKKIDKDKNKCKKPKTTMELLIKEHDKQNKNLLQVFVNKYKQSIVEKKSLIDGKSDQHVRRANEDEEIWDDLVIEDSKLIQKHKLVSNLNLGGANESNYNLISGMNLLQYSQMNLQNNNKIKQYEETVDFPQIVARALDEDLENAGGLDGGLNDDINSVDQDMSKSTVFQLRQQQSRVSKNSLNASPTNRLHSKQASFKSAVDNCQIILKDFQIEYKKEIEANEKLNKRFDFLKLIKESDNQCNEDRKLTEEEEIQIEFIKHCIQNKVLPLPLVDKIKTMGLALKNYALNGDISQSLADLIQVFFRHQLLYRNMQQKVISLRQN